MRTAFLFFAALGATVLPAADLTTRDGQVYRDYKVLGHDTGYLTIMYADGGGKIPLGNLPADLQAKYGYDPVKSTQYVKQDTAAERQARTRIAQRELTTALQQQVAASVETQAVPTGPLTGFPAKFDGHLIAMKGDTPVDFDAHKLTGIKYWAFYYSASGCPPCRMFTPNLVDFYRTFKPSHPDFELVLVNGDQTEDAMIQYMQSDEMPWPAVRFSDVRNPSLDVVKYCGGGIPCLVLVGADGTVLSDTYRGGQYMGPQIVVDDIKTMVK